MDMSGLETLFLMSQYPKYLLIIFMNGQVVYRNQKLLRLFSYFSTAGHLSFHIRIRGEVSLGVSYRGPK